MFDLREFNPQRGDIWEAGNGKRVKVIRSAGPIVLIRELDAEGFPKRDDYARSIGRAYLCAKYQFIRPGDYGHG